ncbi:hypothetical protein [Caballeronia sp. SBC2]|uniref:hypothetical protein n=1 Tax=Caballeronia sp. SBC2 TaxID=2705547 RepID=UPI0013E1DF5E|nr:hypothetical protein [Caballeronia sp. SBC2]QIE22611.1 hypothetical protein SBC2_06210 [Caballeronia sp. SBC2]
MSEKLTIEVPDKLLRQFSCASGYVNGAKGHDQTRRFLLDMAEEGINARLADEDAFYAGGHPSVIINGKILSRDQAMAVWVAITHCGDALKDSEMGPIDEVRSIIGR